MNRLLRILENSCPRRTSFSLAQPCLLTALLACPIIASLGLPPCVHASALADLAAHMQPGTWAVLNTTGFNNGGILAPGGPSDAITQYTDSGGWDPVNRRVLFMGVSHTNPVWTLVSYSEADNTWRTIPPHPSVSDSTLTHAYDHNSVDPRTGDYYHRVFKDNKIFKLNGSTGVWSMLPGPSADGSQVADGLEAFPEMGGLIWVDSIAGVWLYDTSANSWSRLSGSVAMGAYHNFIEYNPVHKVVLFGGGNDAYGARSSDLYKLNSTGQITKLKNAPFPLGITQTMVSVDPNSGRYLIFRTNSEMYEYDVVTDTWNRLPGQTPFGSGEAFETSIPSLGVVMVVNYHFADSKVYLYKHLPGSGMAITADAETPTGQARPFRTADTTAPSGPTLLTHGGLTPSQITIGWSAATDDVGVAGYKIFRNGTQIATTFGTSYINVGLAGGTTYVYTAASYDEAGNTSEPSARLRVRTPTDGSLLPPPASGPNEMPKLSDFDTRCSRVGVIRCYSFDDPVDTDRHVNAPYGQSVKRATVDTAIKASGTGALRFTIPSYSPSDTSGSFSINFTDDLSVQMGEGEEFYVQWRQRFSPEMLNTGFVELGGNELELTGFKQVIIGEGDRHGRAPVGSCTEMEIVVTNRGGQWRDPNGGGYPIMYHSCVHFKGMSVTVDNGGDFVEQNATGCRYGLVRASGRNKSKYAPPCVTYLPDQWMTFQVHVKLGPWSDGYFRQSTVQLWVAEEGHPSRLVVDLSPENGYPFEFYNTQPTFAKYGKVWLLPYQSRKDPNQAHPPAYTWYDDLIISRTRIDEPLVVVDLTPPSIPTTLTTKAQSTSSVALAWQSSVDPESGIARYHVYRNGTVVGRTLTPTYLDSGLQESATYTYEITAMNGNRAESAKSSSATVTTHADKTAPMVVGVTAVGDPTAVVLTFSEPVTVASATDVANYKIAPGITVVSAVIGTDGKTVTLTTSPHSPGRRFTLTVRDIRDRALAPNPIKVNTSTTYAFEPRTLLVDFGKTATADTFGPSGWSHVFHDIYTDYVDQGPGGMAIVVGDNPAYTYAGVEGPARQFVSGQKIVATWYNHSPTPISFSPRLSFTDPDRSNAGVPGTWFSMTPVTVQPFSTGASEYVVTPPAAGMHTFVNINMNHQNAKVLVLDKIELGEMSVEIPRPSGLRGRSSDLPATITMASNASRTLALGPSDPWCATINAATPGEDVVLKPGAYTTPCVISAKGSPFAPITVRSAQADVTQHAIFTYSGHSSNVIELEDAEFLILKDMSIAQTQDGVDAIRFRGSHHVTIEQMTFTGIGGVSIVSNDRVIHHVIVRNNRLRDLKSTGMYFGHHDGRCCFATNLLIEGNFIDGVAPSDASVGYGIQIKLNSRATIRQNSIHHTKGPGIMVYGSSRGDPASIIEGNYVEGSRNEGGIVVGGGPAVVRNNVLAGNALGGISAQNYRGRNLQNDVWLVHNTVLNNQDSGINVQGWSTGSGNVIAYNAILPLAGTPAIRGLDQGTATGNVACMSAAECFVQATRAPFDLRPSVGGPLLDAAGGGVEPWRPRDDFAGITRGQAADIGAFERPPVGSDR